MSDCRFELFCLVGVTACPVEPISSKTNFLLCRYCLKNRRINIVAPLFPVCCVFLDECELLFAYLITTSLEVEDINELTKTTDGPLSELLLESLLLLLKIDNSTAC